MVRDTGGIAEIPLVPTGYERTLPPGVQATVRVRRRQLARQASGRVLDLGGAASHRSLWPGASDVTVLEGVGDPRLPALIADGDAFDTVLSVFQLAAAPDLPVFLRDLASLLRDGGQLRFLEPARRSGWAGRTQRLLAPAVSATAGWHVDRDVPMALRDAGFAVIRLDRHRSPTTQWWVRSLVEGSARRALIRPRR